MEQEKDVQKLINYVDGFGFYEEKKDEMGKRLENMLV